MRDCGGDNLFEVLLREAKLISDGKSSDEEHASSSVNDHGEKDETVRHSSRSCTIRMETNSADDVTDNNNQCCV